MAGRGRIKSARDRPRRWSNNKQQQQRRGTYNNSGDTTPAGGHVTITVDLVVPKHAFHHDDDRTEGRSWVIENREYVETQIRQGLLQQEQEQEHFSEATRHSGDENMEGSEELAEITPTVKSTGQAPPLGCPFHAAGTGRPGTPLSSASSSDSSLVVRLVDDEPNSPVAGNNVMDDNSFNYDNYNNNKNSTYVHDKNALMLETISKVQKQFFECASSAVVFDCLLAALLKLVDGEYGFIGEVKLQEDGETMFLQTRAVTNIAWNKATADFYEETCVKGDGVKFHSYHSLYGSVMTTGQPIIANDAPNDPRAKGVPEGHPPLNAFMGIPFFKGGGVIQGMVGVSNKPGGFSQADVDFLQPFLVTCSNMLYAFTQAEENKRLEAKFAAAPEISMEHNNNSNHGNNPSVPDGANVSARMKSMASQNRRDRPQLFDSKPLAELYLETTVIYCNITGFTSWASTREPSQVFTLLETVFGGFDKIARRQGVCKIETVGDRYVAVSGFPDFQPDHAGRMAQFAQKCVKKFYRCVAQLDLTLGPDTSDLEVRIGIHSGQVLAGVIRGERSSIQLFGDTVNTAAKMETSGRPGRIHISAHTAELLRNERKQYYIEVADDLVVEAKGTISTFWLTRGASDKGGQQELFKDSSESTSIADMFDDELYADRTSRLIEWNVKAMTPLIEKIVARRMAQKTGQSSSVVNLEVRTVQTIPALESNDSTFLDEVKEIIELPAYDLALQEATVVIDRVAEDQLREYIGCIASLYKPNAFHNFEHASHVSMSVQKLLARIAAPSEGDMGTDNTAKAFLSSALHDHTYGITSDPLTPFACAFAALIHDVDHEGVPNPRLIDEKPELGARYRDRSVAEQNSIQIAWDLLMESRFDTLRSTICDSESELRRFRELVVNGVLATDLGDKELKELRNNRWSKAFSKENGLHESRTAAINRKATIVIEHLIQASDVSHTMQHWNVYRKWNERLFVEMWTAYRQGRAAVDPATFWSSGEIGFFEFYIIPLAKKLKNCGVFGVSSEEYLNYALQNLAEWKNKGEEIVAELVQQLELHHHHNHDSTTVVDNNGQEPVVDDASHDDSSDDDDDNDDLKKEVVVVVETAAAVVADHHHVAAVVVAANQQQQQQQQQRPEEPAAVVKNYYYDDRYDDDDNDDDSNWIEI